MIILGIGSNLGNRLTNLRLALEHIKQLSRVTVIRVSPVYISDALLPENAPADWNIPYLNAAIQCESTLEPAALLSALQKIEQALGRKPDHPHWGPRVIDIDILAWDDRIIKNQELTIPHAGLLDRAFALWPLADLVPEWLFPLEGKHHNMPAAQLVEPLGSRFSGETAFHTRQINQRIDTPQFVGILNITPDSFSDGGIYLHPDKAYEQAFQLVQGGASVLDIGAESTRPNATAVNPETEWSRLEPVITAIMDAKNRFLIPPLISIDTRHPETAKKAIRLGVDWINDQTGCDQPEMQTLIADSSVSCVIMHHLSIPEQRDHHLVHHEDPVATVYKWGEQRLAKLEKSGIDRKKCIFDPGIGFGKLADQSLQLLRRIDVFKQLDVPILIGHSRKSFFSLFTASPSAERDIETTALTCMLADKPVDYLRVHHTWKNAQALKIRMAI